MTDDLEKFCSIARKKMSRRDRILREKILQEIPFHIIFMEAWKNFNSFLDGEFIFLLRTIWPGHSQISLRLLATEIWDGKIPNFQCGTDAKNYKDINKKLSKTLSGGSHWTLMVYFTSGSRVLLLLLAFSCYNKLLAIL